MNNEKINFTEIESVPEFVADTRRVCEIRFDCVVTMHDAGYRIYKELWGEVTQSKTPQWFRAKHIITLEGIKYGDPYELGMRIKEMLHQMEDAISKYENGTNF